MMITSLSADRDKDNANILEGSAELTEDGTTTKAVPSLKLAESKPHA
jgi:hypothetical protein